MNWKEKFNKEFKNSFNVGVVPDDMTKAKIETFISNLLKEIKAEAMGEIDKSDNPVRRAGYNAHREHVREVFDKLINQSY